MPPPASFSTRVQRQQTALLEIARAWKRYEHDLDGALRAITETAVSAVGVERASVWLFDESRTKIVCEDLFERTSGRHDRGVELLAASYPRYFAALAGEEVIAATDAYRDERTSEFAASYLEPLSIGAMLDAPIRSGGRIVGVLCHEHVGGEREFHADEQNTASYLASLASLAIELRRRVQSELALEQSLSLLRTAFEATGEGILAVDREGRVTAHNRRFLELWSVPAELLAETRDGGARLHHLAAQTTDPAGFIARARELFAGLELERVDLVELRDGRSIEQTSRPHRSGGAVIGRVWSYRDVTHLRRVEAALRASEERLRELSIRDALTGLYNRRHLHQRLEEETARARRTGRGFSVAMLDLDHFKEINDRHGHLVGDDVLRAFSEDLTGRVRKTDCVGRWGGEEFLLILPETSRVSALVLLEDLRERVARPRPPLPPFTVSVGVAELPADGAGGLLALIAAADARLYEAKHAGRNRVR